MTRKEILETADQTVTKDREDQYGAPENNFQLIADLWTPIMLAHCAPDGKFTGFSAVDVALLLGMLKVARITTGKPKGDNWVDLVGYAACGGEIQTEPHDMDEECDDENCVKVGEDLVYAMGASRKGKWVLDRHGVLQCSICGWAVAVKGHPEREGFQNPPDLCPHCRHKMTNADKTLIQLTEEEQ